MSALGIPVLINPDRAYWLSSIGTDVIHSTIVTDTIDANLGNISTLNAETINTSTLNVSTLGASYFDVSGMYVSSIRGNSAFFSTVTFASDLSGGVGFVRFSVDASGIQVDGDPIRFDNLVYLTSTINIVQVSTLIDTDIFASNGYFSTLSTGSLSSGVASIRQANISSLYVSSLEGFDISGADPVEWSLYPTLNSSIIFQPGNVLSNVGSELFFNGFNLTDLSGGGQQWSRFPAFSTVQMSNNLLVGLSSIVFQDNATLTSLTGNNLRYNGLPVQVGNASNITQWASYPAVSSVNMSNFNLSNASQISGSNLNLTGSNVTNGNTFTGTLAVAGTTLLPLASINNLGQLSCQDIDVSNPAIGLADVNIYGALAVPGDNALYVEGGTTLNGGTIHGFTAGCLPVAGINSCRIDVLQAGVNLLTPTVMAITAGGAIGITAGGALSLAGGGYVEMNTSTLQMINTSQGNKNTTVQAGFLTIDPDLGATSSIKLFNTLGGGVEIDGGGQGSLTGFSTIRANNLSTLNLNVSTIDGVDISSITIPSILDVSAVNVAGNLSVGQSTLTTNLTVANRGSVNNLLYNFCLGISTVTGNISTNSMNIVDNLTGVVNVGPVRARLENFSTAQAGQLSCINLQVSTINGLPWDISGGDPLNNLYSTIGISTMSGLINPGIQGSTININTNLQFIGAGSAPGSGHSISSLRLINSFGENFEAQASTIFLSYTSGPNPNGLIRLGGGGAFDTYIHGPSTILSSIVTATNELYTSTIRATGGLPIKMTNGISFAGGNSFIDNVDLLNTNALAVPVFQINASTMALNATNVKVGTLGSFSTPSLSTGQAWIGDMSGVRTSFSTILNYNPNPALPGGLSSLMNIAVLSNSAVVPNLNGITIENYINYVDNLDIGIEGNGDGAYINAYSANRSTLQNLFFKANNVGIEAPNSLTISQNNVGNPTVIDQFYISTPYINGLSSINDYNPQPAYTNNIQYSTMELYNASTTLLYWSSITTSSNINTTGYDTVVGLDGVYKMGVSLQLLGPGAGNEVEFFFLKNDNIIASSGGIISVANNDEFLTYCEIVEPCSNGDKIQVGCYTANNNVFLSTVNGNILLSPAGILTMYKVG